MIKRDIKMCCYPCSFPIRDNQSSRHEAGEQQKQTDTRQPWHDRTRTTLSSFRASGGESPLCSGGGRKLRVGVLPWTADQQFWAQCAAVSQTQTHYSCSSKLASSLNVSAGKIINRTSRLSRNEGEVKSANYQQEH